MAAFMFNSMEPASAMGDIYIWGYKKISPDVPRLEVIFKPIIILPYLYPKQQKQRK